jgi:hypothetical protein
MKSQWKKRKQTADERKEAKRAKLDPDQTNSAAGGRPVSKEAEEISEEGLTKRQIKIQKKKANKEKKLAQTAAQKAEKQDRENTKDESVQVNEDKKEKATEKAVSEIAMIQTPSNQVNGVKHKEHHPPPSDTTPKTSENKTAQTPAKATPNGTSTSTPPIKKPVMTNGIKTSPSPVQSTSRSPSIPIISSPVPEVPSPTSIPELRARLNERISQARIARKAVGTAVPGAPQTREAILQARAKRKALVQEKIRQKKEQLRKESQDVTGVKTEDSSSEDEVEGSGLTFSRVISGDAEIDAGRGTVKGKKKAKGPSDPKSRLAHLDAKAERLAKMDPEKAEKALTNDRWHHALLAARGERIKDNPSLLKKTIARNEREKKKSKREWDERLAKIERDKEERQRKREENIAKRREEKGKKGKKVKGKKPVVKKKRPGFEGGRVKFGRR